MLWERGDSQRRARVSRRVLLGLAVSTLGAGATWGDPQQAPHEDAATVVLLGMPLEAPATPEATGPAVVYTPQKAGLMMRAAATDAAPPQRRSGHAGSIDPEDLRPDLRRLLDELDHPEYARRDRASQSLRESAGMSRGDLNALMWAAHTPEQINRVLAEQRHRFFFGPRAAMGVSFDPEVLSGPTIERMIDGFPAAVEGKLRVGDEIVSIGDVWMMSMPATGDRYLRPRTAILSYDADDQAEIIVLRRHARALFVGCVERRFGVWGLDQAVKLEVTLGRWSQLPERNGLSSDMLAQAWVLRAQRDGLPLLSETYHTEREARPNAQSIARESMRGPSVQDLSRQNEFRHEMVTGFDEEPAFRARLAQGQDRRRRDADMALQMRQMQQRAQLQQVGVARLRDQGRGPDGEKTTSITIIERRGDLAEHHHTRGSAASMVLARRIAEARASAREARAAARAADQPEVREAAQLRADELDAQAAELAAELAAVSERAAATADPSAGG